MKKPCRKLIVSIASMILVSVILAINSFAEELPTSEDLKNKWYETRFYPIFYDDNLWAKYDLETFYDIENPPMDLLLTMPSDELAKLMMYYPHVLHVTNFWGTDGEQEYDTFFSFCESFSDIFYVLLKRDDGITSLLNAYRISGATAEWLVGDGRNWTTSDDMFRWYAEVACSQFITHYADHFSPEECELANEIIDEKNEIYSRTDELTTYYLNMSHIEVNENYTKEIVRSNYLTDSEIRKKEKVIKDTIAKIISASLQLCLSCYTR